MKVLYIIQACFQQFFYKILFGRLLILVGRSCQFNWII